jgi:ATP synthase protein I
VHFTLKGTKTFEKRSLLREAFFKSLRTWFKSKRAFFSMKRETRRTLKELAYYSSLGFSVSLSIVIGLAIGVYLDRKVFNTTPWLTLIFLGLGIAAGFRNIALAIKKSKKL